MSFGGTRTFHRMACAVEDGGFEIRDSIAWLYGSGFPKSLDVGKAIDKAAGAEREVLGVRSYPTQPNGRSNIGHGQQGYNVGATSGTGTGNVVTAPATPAVREWAGWGTALKPAFEPVVVARKPPVGSVAGNVQEWGTGALNIDGCRVPHNGDIANAAGGGQGRGREGANAGGPAFGVGLGGVVAEPHPTGRWPANVVLDGSQADALGDSASKFFPAFRYQAKAPTRERPSYLKEGAEDHRSGGNFAGGIRVCNVCQNRTKPGNYIAGDERPWPACGHNDWEWGTPKEQSGKVSHPTVKPLGLMRWLVRLVTPPAAPTLVCCVCGEDVHGMRSSVPTEAPRAASVRDAVSAEAGGTITEGAATAVPHVRGTDHGPGEDVLLGEVPRRGAAVAGEELSGLRAGVPTGSVAQAVLFEGVRRPGDGITTEDVRAVLDDVSAAVVTGAVLLTRVRSDGHGYGEAQGADADVARLRAGVHAGAPDGDADGVHPAAPSRDGRSPGAHAEPRRSGASPERGERRQPPDELAGVAEAHARPDTEATTEADLVSALRREDRGFGSCASCGGALEIRDRPGVVLDPFAGSGATVEACLIEGFDCIAIERDPESLPLIQIRIDRQAGTLPFEDVS